LGTNTSQEIEALHKALREVGLSPTIKNDSQPFDLSSQGNKSTQEMVQKILSGEPGMWSTFTIIIMVYWSTFTIIIVVYSSACFDVCRGGGKVEILCQK